MQGHVLLEGLLDAGKEGFYSLLTLDMGRLLGDAQELDYGVSVIFILQGLSSGSLLHHMSCVTLFSGLHNTATYSWVTFRTSS